MELDLLRLRPHESQAGSILQNHFLRQRQSGDPVNLTRDLKLVAMCALHWSPNPALLLKTIGILFFDGFAAFNLSLAAGHLVLCRARAIAAFAREGWREAGGHERIATVVGANEVKHWTAMGVPPGTELAEFLAGNPKLAVSEQSFRLDRTPDEVLIGPGLPPQDVLSEPHFPLVSIFYQQSTDAVSEVADVPPRARKMEYSLGYQITIDEQRA
jgi:hypothetical protein